MNDSSTDPGRALSGHDNLPADTGVARDNLVGPGPVPALTGNPTDRVTLSGTNVRLATMSVGQGDPVYARPVARLSPQGAARLRAGQLEELKDSLLQQYPNVRDQARIAIHARLIQAHYLEVDPDHTYFNTFGSASSSSRSYNGWQHQGRPLQSMNLTDIQLRNFPAAFGEDPNGLNAYGGVYTQGADATAFGTHNEVRLLASDLKDAVRDNDFYRSYYAALEHYYDRNADALTTVAAAGTLQYVEARMHAAELARLQGADMATGSPMTLSLKALGMISEPAGHAAGGGVSHGTVAHVFDIDSYPSRDMSWLQANDGHVVLLMPGAEHPVREFRNLDAMRAGIGQMVATAGGREQLGRHFSIYNRRDGMTYQGVDKWLGDIAAGGYDARIAYAPQRITGDVFANQVARMRETDLDNVHYLVRSDTDINRTEMIQAFGAFNGILGNPLTQVAELGLDLYEIRAAGIGDGHDYAVADAWRTSIGLGLNLLVAGMVGAGEGIMPRAAGELPSRGATRALTDDIPLQTLTPDEPAAAVIDPAEAGTSHATGNAYRNGRGMLERRDFQFLYRVVASQRAALSDPTQIGFSPSTWFEVPRMTDGPAVITSSTMQGALRFGDGMFRGDFKLYQIDAEGLRAVSLEENARNNATALSRHFGYEDEGMVASWMEDGLESNVGDGALDYDEVHLDLRELTPGRIRLVPQSHYPRTIASGYESSAAMSSRGGSEGGDSD